MAETKSEKIEREYVIPLRPKWKNVARYKRANKAVKTIREFLVKHMKIRDRDLDKVRIDKLLNEYVWQRSIRHPPTKIKVKAIKEGDKIIVQLAELPENLKFKKIRLENRDKKAAEAVDKKKSAIDRLKEARGQKEEENKAQETPEQAKDREEKKEASVEATKGLEKESAKQSRHETKKNPSLPKHQRRMALEK
jgi:large subunit ribosomal protein L31e